MNGGIAPSHGPRYGITSVSATHAPKSSAYCCACGSKPVAARIQIPTPALTPMISESASLAAHVRRERVLHAAQQRQLDRVAAG